MDHCHPPGGNLLIDVSSLMFHIIFACINLFDKKCIQNCDKETYILKCFKKMFIRKVQSLINLHQTSKLVFARDVSKKNLWRNNIYDKYKSHRSCTTKHKGCSLNIRSYFSCIFHNIYDKIVSELNAITIKVSCAEADDIIMILTKYLNFQNERVVIISDDNDYYPLLHYHNVSIYDNHGKNFANKSFHIKPMDYMRLKILKGDKSDNVPACNVLKDQFGILKKRYIQMRDVHIYVKLGIFKIDTIDKELAISMIENPTKIVNLRELDPLFNETYIRNSILIDMNYIPKDIQQMIITHFVENGQGTSTSS